MTLCWETLKDTQSAATKLGEVLQSGDVIGLIGPLGAGKTAFVQGVAKGLSVPESYRVTSPTFVYAQSYPGRIPLHHLDLYRIESDKHLSQLGLAEMLGEGVSLVEWYDLFPGLVEDRLEIHMNFGTSSERVVKLNAKGRRPGALLKTLEKLWA